MEVFPNTTVVIILQYISVSNQHGVDLKRLQCYQSYLNKAEKNPQTQNTNNHNTISFLC